MIEMKPGIFSRFAIPLIKLIMNKQNSIYNTAPCWNYKNLSEQLTNLKKTLDSIEKPKYDCVVTTQDYFNNILKPGIPIMAEEKETSIYNIVGDLPIYICPDETTARARYIVLESENHRPLLYI